MGQPTLTIGITTRNRSAALTRCLSSLMHLAGLCPEVIVYDDSSSPPAASIVEGLGLPIPVRVLRDESAPGYIVGRNRLVRQARGCLVLLLDDDASILEGGAVEAAMNLMNADSGVAAVAFAQADGAGTPWPEAMQPGRGVQACYVPSFIGFAHLLRRDVFLALGGYRERFVYYGEEKDYCLRLIDKGFRTVYLPDAKVAHEPESAGRDNKRYLRYVTRNDCLYTLYNQPLTRAIWLLPARGVLYFKMRRAWKVRDAWGWLWVGREVVRSLPAVIGERRPVSTRTIAVWQLLKDGEPYPLAGAAGRAGDPPAHPAHASTHLTTSIFS